MDSKYYKLLKDITVYTNKLYFFRVVKYGVTGSTGNIKETY